MDNPLPPQPPETPSQQPGSDFKQWSLILHISPLAGIVVPALGNIVAPLIIWLIKKQEIPALVEDGKGVLNAQISWAIWIIASGFVGAIGSCFFIPPVLPLGFAIAWLVFTIIDAIKTSNGEPYSFPLTVKFLK